MVLRCLEMYEHEPGHDKICLMPYANNKGADQPAHLHTLIRTFIVRCLDSLSLTWSHTTEDRFSGDVAQMYAFFSGTQFPMPMPGMGGTSNPPYPPSSGYPGSTPQYPTPSYPGQFTGYPQQQQAGMTGYPSSYPPATGSGYPPTTQSYPPPYTTQAGGYQESSTSSTSKFWLPSYHTVVSPNLHSSG